MTGVENSNLPAGLHLHVVPLTNVVDVHWDGSVGSDAVLLHQSDEIRLREVVWRTCLSFR